MTRNVTTVALLRYSALCGILLLLCLSGTLVDVINQYFQNPSLVAANKNSLPDSNDATTGTLTVPVNRSRESDAVRLIDDPSINSNDSSLPQLVPAKKSEYRIHMLLNNIKY